MLELVIYEDQFKKISTYKASLNKLDEINDEIAFKLKQLDRKIIAYILFSTETIVKRYLNMYISLDNLIKINLNKKDEV